MFLSFLVVAPPFGTAVAFLAGGAAGIFWTRVARAHQGASTLALIEWDHATETEDAPALGDATQWSSAAELESPEPPPRVRTGRLPLPQCVTALTPTDEPALALVDIFVDHLAELPCDEWLAVGHR